jgi:signal transduction histidine kinase/HAMP domain-containing protein
MTNGHASKPRRPAFGRLLLVMLGLTMVSELLIGLAIYRRLRTELESDLGLRLVHVAKLLAAGTDPTLVGQFREGDEGLAAYRMVADRFAALARAGGVERAYIVDGGLQTLVDTAPGSAPGRMRYALLANRVEIEAARHGTAMPTRLYRDEEGRQRLSALAPLPAAPGRPVAFVGVDANPEFFTSLGALRRQMALLAAAGLLTAGAAGLVLIRQVSRRLNRLRDVVSRVARGDLAGRVGFAGRDEIDALGQDLDGMVISLVAARDYYEAVLASADVGLLATDRRGKILGANPRALALLAPGTQTLAGQSVTELLRDEEAVAGLVAAVLAGEAAPLASECALAGGPLAGGRLVAATASRLEQGGEWSGVILAVSDVTDLRALESKVRRHERLAGLGSMAAGLLHEVRNPLSSMTLYLDLLKTFTLEGEGQEILERATAEASRLDRFLKDFQIFAGLRPLRLQWIDVPTVVESAMDGLVAEELARVVRTPGVRAAVHADPGLLAHAIRNLVVNGLQAAAPEGLVTVKAEQEGGMVLITVSDDGPGIAEEKRERIFDPLFTTKSSGSGLGLTIVQRVAEAHGATVEVRNRPEGGAVFVLRFARAAEAG